MTIRNLKQHGQMHSKPVMPITGDKRRLSAGVFCRYSAGHGLWEVTRR